MKKILLTLLIATNLSSKTQVPAGMDLTVTGKEPVDIEQIKNLKNENNLLREDLGMYMDSIHNYAVDQEGLLAENEELKKKVQKQESYLNSMPTALEKTGISTDAKTAIIIVGVCFVGGYVLAKSNGVTYLVKASSLVDKGVEQTKKGGSKLFGWMKKKTKPVIDATTYQDHLSDKPEAQIFIKKWKKFWKEIKDEVDWQNVTCNAAEIKVIGRDGAAISIKIPTQEEENRKPWYKKIFK